MSVSHACSDARIIFAAVFCLACVLSLFMPIWWIECSRTCRWPLMKFLGPHSDPSSASLGILPCIIVLLHSICFASASLQCRLEEAHHYIQGVCWDPRSEYAVTLSSDRWGHLHVCHCLEFSVCVCVCVCVLALFITMKRKCPMNGKRDKRHTQYLWALCKAIHNCRIPPLHHWNHELQIATMSIGVPRKQTPTPSSCVCVTMKTKYYTNGKHD